MNTKMEDLFTEALDESVPETWSSLSPEQLSKFKTSFYDLIVSDTKDAIIDAWYDQGLDIRGANISKFLEMFNQYFEATNSDINFDPHPER